MSKSVDKEKVETIKKWVQFDKEQIDIIYITIDFLLNQLEEHLSNTQFF